MQIIYSPKCLEYKKESHPESPERIALIVKVLKENGFKFIEPRPASEDEVSLVHSQSLIEQVKSGTFSDPDTPALKDIFNYALLAAGGAIMAMNESLNSKPSFSLMRPPGHHAGRNFLGGFCYFNNLAVSVAKALQKVNKIAILDIDCHHGNGTEDIFLREKRVLYASLHGSPLYPYTGLASHSNCINFPLPLATREGVYLKNLNTALKKISKFSPNLLAVSAGFDTYKKDPLTYFGLEIETYQKVGQMIAGLKIPFFAVLEGGYSKDLPECVLQFLRGLATSFLFI